MGMGGRRGRNPYHVLGVRPEDSDEVVRAAYHALAKVYHPDTPTGDAERFKELHEAYRSIVEERTRED